MSSERNEQKQVIEKYLPGYRVEKRLGKGASGSVYECVKEDAAASLVTREAVKVISVSYEDAEFEIEDLGITPEAYFSDRKIKAVEEIKFMDQLKGPHIVHINDYAVIDKEDQPGFHILIRMDLLSSLAKILKDHETDTQEQAEAFAKKLALDMCEALILCHKKGAAHRDIKPQNVFMSENGEFYLGDFGFAKKLNSSMSQLSYRGTESYIAPEVATGTYDHRVDLYSLGLVLYQILNHGRLPFYPPYPQQATAQDEERSYSRRALLKEPVPAPDNASPVFAKIVLQLCEHNPDKRFKNAAELKQAILALDHAAADNSSAESKPKRRKLRRTLLGISAIALILAIAAVAIVIKSRQGSQNEADNPGSSKTNTVKVSEPPDELPSATPAPTKNPDKDSSKKIKLTSLTMVEGEHAEVKTQINNTLGNTYDEALVIGDPYGKEAYARFYVGDHNYLSGNFSCPEDYVETGAEYRLIVFLDDNEEEPLEKTTMNRSSIVTPFAYDVSDAQFITFKVKNLSSSSCGVMLTDSWLYEEAANLPSSRPDSSVNASADKTKLTDFKIVEGAKAELVTQIENTLGTIYEEAVVIGDPYGKEAYARFYVEDYSRLVGNFSCPQDYLETGQECRLVIYLDNMEEEPLEKITLNRSTAVTPLNLDVSDAQFITFKVENPSAASCGILLTDCWLYGNGSKIPSTIPDSMATAAPDKLRLTASTIVEGSHAEKATQIQNTLGNTFEEAVVIGDAYGKEAYARFYVSDFNSLNGNISCPDNYVETGAEYRLVIYPDNKEEEPLQVINMSRSMAITSINLDISGAQFITVKVENPASTSCGVLLSDCCFTK